MSEITRAILVPGTWGDAVGGSPDWFEVGGVFYNRLIHEGLSICSPGRPWWTTDLEGSPWEWLIAKKVPEVGWHRDWKVGGHSISHELREHVPDSTAVVAFVHSHGLNPLLYALADPSTPAIGALCSVGSPDRDDMREIAELARPKIGRWLHIQDPGHRDAMKWLGTLGSGSWRDTVGAILGLTRGHARADRWHTVEGLGHSRMLEDAACLPRWDSAGLLGYLLRDEALGRITSAKAV